MPLHTNGSENDIRCHVTRRKVSAGTRSDIGRDCALLLARQAYLLDERSGRQSSYLVEASLAEVLATPYLRLPDGRLASGSWDNTIRLWDLKTGADRSSNRPASDDWLPPSKSTFLRRTDGISKGSVVSSVMAAVALG